MPEATSPDDNPELTKGDQLEQIGDEFGVHREDDEDDQTYGNRILVELENSIDELIELQGAVHALLEQHP